MPGTRTFLDAGVLITAFQGRSEHALKALDLVNDPDREFIISPYLKLELLSARFDFASLAPFC
jgi:hypothetical protein